MLADLYKNVVIENLDIKMDDVIIDDFLEKDEFNINMELLDKKWSFSFDDLVNNPLIFDLLIYRNLNIYDFNDLDLINEKITISNREISSMLRNLDDLYKSGDFTDKDYEAYKGKLNRYAEIGLYAGQTILNKFHSMKAFFKYHDISMNLDRLERFTTEEELFKDERLKFIDETLNEIEKFKLKKINNSLYSKKIVDNIDTFTYMFYKDIETFMNDTFGNRFEDVEKWKLLNKNDTKKICDKIANNNRDPRAPTLNIDRYKFAFRNGIYLMITKEGDMCKDVFIPYTDKTLLKKYKVDEASPINFFDMDYPQELIDNTYTNFYDIPTPNYSKIIDYQIEDDEVKKFFYMLMGRCLTKLGDFDKWQIMPILKGLAGTGKGTALKIINFLYSEHYIGTIENNIEKGFGLEGLYEKLVIIGPEIGNELQLDQMKFQKMVSGEPISIPRKGKIAIEKEWDSHMIWAANELPNYNDNSGSIQRRMVIFQFDKPVDKNDSDTDLEIKIKMEIPYILTKLARAYQYYINNNKGKNFWKFCPEYFEIQRDALATDRNPLFEFLMSEEIEYGENCFVQVKTLKERFNQVNRVLSNSKEHVTADNLKSPLDTCCKKKGVKSQYIQNTYNYKAVKVFYEDNTSYTAEMYGDFVIGIRLKEEDKDDRIKPSRIEIVENK